MASLHALQGASCLRRCRAVSPASRRAPAKQLSRCNAGFGFLENEPVTEVPEIVVPKSAFGLNMSQMAAMGITGEDVQRYQTGMTEVRLVASSPRVRYRHTLSNGADLRIMIDTSVLLNLARRGPCGA